MDLLLILLKRLAVMFIFIIIGAILYRKDKVTEKGSASLANLLITLILPCVIIKSFLTEHTRQQTIYLLYSLLFSLIILAIAIGIARIFFRKDAIAHFAAAFSNPGFFGIPLILAVLGDSAVLLAAPFIAYLNIFQSTYGVAVLTGEKGKSSISIKKIVLSPFIISFIIGLLLFFLPVTLPQIVEDVITASANLNTPIAMIVSGVYLAKTDIKAMVKNIKLYGISAVRLIVIPLIALGVLSILPDEFLPLKMCLLIAVACPVGSNVAVYAQLHQKDYCYAAETVVISTLLSALTIPLLVMLAQMIWHVSS